MDPLNVPPELILDLALAIHPHDKIAQKYGLSEHELLKLHTQEWFNQQIDAQRQALAKAGFDFKAKVRILAEAMVVDAYQAAMKSDAVTPKLDVAKHLTKLAGLEPAPGLAAAQGAPSFSININFSGGRETITLEANRAEESKPVGADVWTIDGAFGGGADIPGRPLALSVPVRETNAELREPADSGEN